MTCKAQDISELMKKTNLSFANMTEKSLSKSLCGLDKKYCFVFLSRNDININGLNVKGMREKISDMIKLSRPYMEHFNHIPNFGYEYEDSLLSGFPLYGKTTDQISGDMKDLLKIRAVHDKSKESSPVKGYIYVLSNDSMPGLLKIGYTERDVSLRCSELNTTGVPTKFKIQSVIPSIDSPVEVEKRIHEKMDKYRKSGNREFFELDVVTALKIVLKMMNPKKETGPRVVGTKDIKNEMKTISNPEEDYSHYFSGSERQGDPLSILRPQGYNSIFS